MRTDIRTSSDIRPHSTTRPIKLYVPRICTKRTMSTATFELAEVNIDVTFCTERKLATGDSISPISIGSAGAVNTGYVKCSYLRGHNDNYNCIPKDPEYYPE